MANFKLRQTGEQIQKDLDKIENDALVKPASAPSDTAIVSIDNTNTQTMLTVGDGLSVENGELKATGGLTDIQQTTGQSTTAVMSQKATTDEIDALKSDINDIKSGTIQQTPLFANSIDELNASGDTTKVYVLPDGYIYAYRTFKNYNLLKLSEVSYSSRLQNDVAGIIASNANNLVTGWIPVKYGKYYTPSILFNGSRIVGSSTFSLIVRVNVKLADGTIIVYGNTVDDRNKILYTPGVNETITLEHENAVAVMLHFFINNQDISTQAKFEAYQPMVIEGDSIEDATNKATTYEYISGDVE